MKINPQKKEIWLRAFLWLLFLGPFFFISYGWVNSFTATQNVGHMVFDFDRHIPFWPWTIIPYWSLDILYGLSLFICTTKRELNIHALRLLFASIICCTCFLLFPLKFTFEQPEVSGVLGYMFKVLKSFDLPYNQAPSLHIVLAWVVWLRFKSHISQSMMWIFDLWFLLIGISVLTTWQHHFIDIPTGFLAGVVITYLLPIETRWKKWKCADKNQAFKLFIFYTIGALFFATLTTIGGYAWLFLYPSISFALVAIGYLYFGTSIFQKTNDGRVSTSSLVLLAPYRLFAWISFLYFTAKMPKVSQITPTVFLGSLPCQKVKQDNLLDMTAEFSSNLLEISLPRMDLVSPTAEELQEAVETLNRFEKQGSVLIFCALGLSRSSLVVAAWLLAEGIAKDINEAIEIIRVKRGQIVLSNKHKEILNIWLDRYH